MQRLSHITALTALCCATASPGMSQTFPVKKCDVPKEPLGILHAQGQVTYRMAQDGKVDTGSIRIVTVRGISAAGLRSAAVRELAVCRFDRSGDTTTGPVVVVDAIGFDSATTMVSAATVVPSSIVAMEIPARAQLPADAIAETDSTVEERPRRLRCDRQADIQQFTGSFRSRQDRDAAFAAWQRQNSGVALARIVVDIEGRVSPEGIVITSSTNPAMTTSFVAVLASCRYVPGRIAGVPVATIVATRTGIGSSSGP